MSYHELTEKIYKDFSGKAADDKMICEWLQDKIDKITFDWSLSLEQKFKLIKIFGLVPAPKKGIHPIIISGFLPSEHIARKLNEVIVKLNDMDKGE